MSKQVIFIANSVLLAGFSQFTVADSERARLTFELNDDAGSIPTLTAAALAVEVCTDPYAPFSTFVPYKPDGVTPLVFDGLTVTDYEIVDPGVYRVVYTPWVLDNTPPYSGPLVVASGSFQKVAYTKGLPYPLPVPGDAGELLTRTGEDKKDVKFIPLDVQAIIDAAVAAAVIAIPGAVITCDEGADIEAAITLAITNGGDITVAGEAISDVYPNPNGNPVAAAVLFVNATFFASPATATATTINGATLAGLPAGFSASLVSAGVRNTTDDVVEPVALIGFNANQFQNSVVTGKNYEYRLVFAVTKSTVCP